MPLLNAPLSKRAVASCLPLQFDLDANGSASPEWQVNGLSQSRCQVDERGSRVV